MAELWAPTGPEASEWMRRQEQSPNVEKLKKVETENIERLFADALTKFMEKHKDRSPPQQGRALGRLFMEFTLNIVGTREPEARVRDKLEAMHRSFRRLQGETFEQFKSGFLGELAFMRAVADKIGYPLYLSTEDEDINGGIDCWLHDDAGQMLSEGFAVQVKGISTTKAERGGWQLIHSPTSKEDIRDLAITYMDPEYQQGFEASGKNMLDFCKRYDNVKPLYVFIPISGERSLRQADQLTGEPKSVLINQLSREINEKLMREGMR